MSGPLDRFIAFLPQKEPFLFVDELLELVHEVSAVGAKTFPSGDPIFRNHLPGEPLVPGVIIIEALAQLSGIVLVPREGRPVWGYLGEVGAMRFRRLVRPDERIVLRSSLERRLGSAARFEVEASVGGVVAAAGMISLGLSSA